MITRKLKESILTLSLDPIFNNLNLLTCVKLGFPFLIDKIIELEVSNQEDIINNLNNLKDLHLSKSINSEQLKIKLHQIVGGDIIRRV